MSTDKIIRDAARKILSVNVIDIHRETGLRMEDISRSISRMKKRGRQWARVENHVYAEIVGDTRCNVIRRLVEPEIPEIIKRNGWGTSPGSFH